MRVVEVEDDDDIEFRGPSKTKNASEVDKRPRQRGDVS